jgi:hypothetical protein
MMQPDYNELAKRQQQDYQSSRDPFQYGQQVAQRRYSEMMSNLDRQRQSTQQSYGDLYSQARQRAVGGAAAGGPTLSGGMGQQQRDFVSAIEMQELGRIGQAREGASRDLFSQGQAAFSNAQLEGQQATQMQLGNQQAQLGLVQQRQSILANKDLTDEQRSEQLEALGQSPEAVVEKQRTWDQWLISGGTAVGTGAVAIGGLTKLGAGVAAAMPVLKAAGVGSYFAASGAATFKGAVALLGGFKAAGLSGMLAASLATNPVGWTIGAVVVGAVAIGAIAGAVRQSNT